MSWASDSPSGCERGATTGFEALALGACMDASSPGLSAEKRSFRGGFSDPVAGFVALSAGTGFCTDGDVVAVTGCSSSVLLPVRVDGDFVLPVSGEVGFAGREG